MGNFLKQLVVLSIFASFSWGPLVTNLFGPPSHGDLFFLAILFVYRLVLGATKMVEKHRKVDSFGRVFFSVLQIWDFHTGGRAMISDVFGVSAICFSCES